jgi:hypothetical protein
MANRIEEYNLVVVQKQRGGIAPRLQLQMGGAPVVAQLMLRYEELDARVGNRVASERAEAAARGVHVVYEDTRVEHFVEILLPD